MSQFPLGEPRQPSQIVSRREQVSDEIEAQAGKALSREFWMSATETPFGDLSRRSILLALLAMVLVIFSLIALFWMIITTPPQLAVLPNTDANTVTTHIFANFSGNKSPQPELFFPPNNQSWRFTEAYTFYWQDRQGTQQQVVILQYGNIDNLLADYSYLTRPVTSDDRSQVIYLNDDMLIEQRDLKAYGGEWRGFWLGNMLLLMTSNVDRRDQQELYSHFVTIMAANQRDFIPTPTPY